VKISNKLPRSFYLQRTLKVAKDLLGKHLIRKIGRSTLIGKIVEVEAYLGEKDPASHAYRGKTKRNEVMFLEGGHLYVYFTYGMHYCCNVVTEKKGIGHAVLLRAIEPVEGIERMMKNRKKNRSNGIIKNRSDGVLEDWRNEKMVNLTNGPAKLCQAFGVARTQNGTDLLGDEIFITNRPKIPNSKIGQSTRIGIRNGKEKLWRFYIKENPFVSR
jgi:DNA-3-methyladenine glycosylase